MIQQAFDEVLFLRGPFVLVSLVDLEVIMQMLLIQLLKYPLSMR